MAQRVLYGSFFDLFAPFRIWLAHAALLGGRPQRMSSTAADKFSDTLLHQLGSRPLLPTGRKDRLLSRHPFLPGFPWRNGQYTFRRLQQMAI